MDTPSKKLLNLGCGANKIKGALNVDMNESVGADLCFDITCKFPLADEEFDEIYFFHCIEHLEKWKHPFILTEIHRVLKLGGILYISYPEFAEIAKNWLDRNNNDRKFWEATIYGRQLAVGDYHVAAMDTLELKETLFNCGFLVKQSFKESHQPFNSVIIAARGNSLPTYEQLLYEGVFAK